MSLQYFDSGAESTPFHLVYYWLRAELLEAQQVDVGEWHAMNVKGKLELVTRELRAVTFHTKMPDNRADAVIEYEPNIPWAELQFQERVSGEPLNPGESYKEWPWQSAMTRHTEKDAGKFSHTYMERYWPRRAGSGVGPSGPFTEHHGIRYRYGDLSDVVDLLDRSPHTRQAVLPVWFPEDTGGVHRGRLPCSLTYHFIRRREADGTDRLHCEYSIRSCDFVRHFRDDVYMTVRLTQWVLEELKKKESAAAWSDPHLDSTTWLDTLPGTLTMHIGSLHIFEGDVARLTKEATDDEA